MKILKGQSNLHKFVSISQCGMMNVILEVKNKRCVATNNYCLAYCDIEIEEFDVIISDKILIPPRIWKLAYINKQLGIDESDYKIQFSYQNKHGRYITEIIQKDLNFTEFPKYESNIIPQPKRRFVNLDLTFLRKYGKKQVILSISPNMSYKNPVKIYSNPGFRFLGVIAPFKIINSEPEDFVFNDKVEKIYKLKQEKIN